MHLMAKFNEGPGAFYPVFSLTVLTSQALFSGTQTANPMRVFTFIETNPRSPAQ